MGDLFSNWHRLAQIGLALVGFAMMYFGFNFGFWAVIGAVGWYGYDWWMGREDKPSEPEVPKKDEKKSK